MTMGEHATSIKIQLTQKEGEYYFTDFLDTPLFVRVVEQGSHINYFLKNDNNSSFPGILLRTEKASPCTLITKAKETITFLVENEHWKMGKRSIYFGSRILSEMEKVFEELYCANKKRKGAVIMFHIDERGTQVSGVLIDNTFSIIASMHPHDKGALMRRHLFSNHYTKLLKEFCTIVRHAIPDKELTVAMS